MFLSFHIIAELRSRAAGRFIPCSFCFRDPDTSAFRSPFDPIYLYTNHT